MRKLTLPILIAVSAILFMIGMLSAQTDVMTLKSSKGDVTFPHKKHADAFQCVDCHHTAKGGETPKACRECHKKGAAVSAQKAFHSKSKTTSCVGCHTEQGKGPKYSPCSGCHKK